MIRFIFALLAGVAILFNAQLISAQNRITGTIQNEINETLAGANIVVANTTIGTASDADGNYMLTGLDNGEYMVRVSFFGYGTQEKQVVLSGNDVSLNFTLEETAIDLDAVVVTGTRTEKSLKNTPILTQSISIQELENKDAVDITQALEFVVPGLEFSNQAQGKSISLQGIDPQYMLFLVNGERLAGETYGDIDYSRINLADIERIEVVKGASSTLYGSNALGGVINIITKTPAKKLGINASTRFSKYNTQNYRFSLGSSLGKFSTQTSATFDKTDGYDLLEGNSYRTQEKEDALVLNQRFKYAFSKNFQLEAYGAYMDKNRDNTSEDLNDRKNKNFTYGAKASYFPNQKSDFALSWNSDNYEILDKVSDGTLNSVYNNLNNTARLIGNVRPTDWSVVTVGVESNSENLTASRNDIEDKTNSDLIMFAQMDVERDEHYSLVAGLRTHNNSQYGWYSTPQISGMYKVWHLAFRGNYSMGYKTPTLKEKYMSFRIPAPGPPMFLVGNENLKPETSNYFSLSAEYTRKGVSFSVSAYENRIQDMISENLDTFRIKPGGIIEYEYRNYGKVTIRGVDILMKTKIVRNLLFTGSVTFSKKYNEIKEEEFDNVRKFSGKFNLDYNYSLRNYDLNANLQSNWYGGRSINLMDERTHQVTKVDLDPFSLWKLTTTHTLKKQYYLRLGVDNIFDFVDKSGGYNSGTPGRTYFIGLGLKI